MSGGAQQYNFDKSVYFVGAKALSVGQMIREIEDSGSGIGKPLVNVFDNTALDRVEVTFEQALDASEQAALTALVQAHTVLRDDYQVWLASDERGTGTLGGDAVAGQWQQRALNTLRGSERDECTLSDNRIVLKPGAYYVQASAPAWQCGKHQIRLYNVDDASVALYGSVASSPASGAQHAAQTESQLRGTLRVPEHVASATYELQHHSERAKSRSGLGRANGVAGAVEVYSTVNIQRLL